MANPRVTVRMGQEFYDVISLFAIEQECTIAEVMLHATKALMSRAHRWKTGTRARGLRRARPPKRVKDRNNYARTRIAQEGALRGNLEGG